MRIYLKNGPDAGNKYEIPAEMECVNFGSDPDNHVVLEAEGVSRHHAAFHWRNGAWYILDLRSTNGTFLNGQAVVLPTPLKYGDEIVMGAQRIEVTERDLESGDGIALTDKIPKQEIHSPLDAMPSLVEHLKFVPQGGLRLGDYLLEKRLGAGGMGEVWRAEQVTLRRKVAVKIIDPEITRNPVLLQRFQSEVRISAMLNHPNIVMAIDAGMMDGLYFLVIAYVNGDTVEEILNRQGLISEMEALAIIECVADALHYAWVKFKLIHRDIKPGNIMIDRTGDVKLMDLGISKSLINPAPMMTTTAQGLIVGTPYYMSPEQAQNESDLDCQTDIYSLGITLFQMLAGHLPYNAATPMAMFTSLVSDPVPMIGSVNPEISRATENVLFMMMAKDRRKRYKSWDAVRDAVRRILDGEIR